MRGIFKTQTFRELQRIAAEERRHHLADVVRCAPAAFRHESDPRGEQTEHHQRVEQRRRLKMDVEVDQDSRHDDDGARTGQAPTQHGAAVEKQHADSHEQHAFTHDHSNDVSADRTDFAPAGAAADSSPGQAAYERGRTLMAHRTTDDDRAACELFRAAAERGHAPAQYSLGLCYGSGRGVPEDLAAANRWYRRAADQGFAKAQHYLGLVYADGDGDQGKVTIHLTYEVDALYGVVIQPDAKIVSVGEVGGRGGRFAVLRSNPDGFVDGTSGVNGWVATNFTRGLDAAGDVAVQSDGKIVAAGLAGGADPINLIMFVL